MSIIRRLITQIENLNVEQLCEALEYNGYGDCVDRIRNKSIDGQAFLKLTEVQVSLWRLSPPQMRRLWSFIEHVRQNPSNFVFVPKKAPSPVSNFNNVQTNSLGRPQLKQRSKPAERTKIENVESKSTNGKFSTLPKQHSESVKDKLELLFKADTTRNNSFLHTVKPSLPKPPIKKYVEEQYDDDDLNDGYLPPINIEQANSKPPSSEIKNTFLNKTRQSYENHTIEQEPPPPVALSNKKIPKRPLPPIPREIGLPKFQNKQERPNLSPQKPKNKIATVFKRPLVSRPKLEEPEEEIEEYAAVLEEEPVSFSRPLPAIPVEHDEDLQEYGSISEEEDLPEYGSISEEEELDTKLPFKPVVQPPNFLTQLKSATHQKYKESSVKEEEEDLVYEPVLDVVEEKKMFSKPSIDLKSRPLPPPPTFPSRSRPKVNEERLLPPVPNFSKRPNQKTNEKTEDGSDSEEEIVLNELMKMSREVEITSTSPSGTVEKSRSPTNLPKPPSITLPKPPQFGDLKVAGSDVLVNKEPKIFPKDDFEKEIYYRETDRKGARKILSNLEEGTFLVRPSRDIDYICTLSIMHSKKMFNVGVQRDQITGILTLGSMMDVEQPDFKKLKDIINYYCVNPLCLSGELIVLKNILPFERR